MGDSMVLLMLSCQAMLSTLLVAHIIAWLVLRYGKGKGIRAIRRWLRRQSKWVYRHTSSHELTGWLLFSATAGMYIALLVNPLFFLGVAIMLIAWIVFILWVAVPKWRKKYLYGYRATHFYLQSLYVEVISVVAYVLLYDVEWFKTLFSDASEEDKLCGFATYPNIESLFSVVDVACIIAVLNLIPLLILWSARGFKFICKTSKA